MNDVALAIVPLIDFPALYFHMQKLEIIRA